jgi:hypothetical protein
MNLITMIFSKVHQLQRRNWGVRWFTGTMSLSFSHLSPLPFLVQQIGCQTASAKKLLGSIHRLACLGVIGATHTNQTCAMETLLAFLHSTCWFKARLCQLHTDSACWSLPPPQLRTQRCWCSFKSHTPPLVRGPR